MVFFTSIIIVAIFYFLQADGLIYITLIALGAEMLNIFLTHTLTKSVEEKMKKRHRKSVQGYLSRIKSNKKTIRDLEKVQDDAATKLYKANEKIKSLEQEIASLAGSPKPAAPKPPAEPEPLKSKQKNEPAPASSPADIRDHLPDGSKRNQPPV